MPGVSSFPRSSNDGLDILYSAITMVLQTLGFGMHLFLIPFGIHVLLKRQSSAQPTAYILLAMLLPLLSSSLFWALTFAGLLVSIQIFPVPADHYTEGFTFYLNLFYTITLVNYLIADGVIVWRAWVLCKDEYQRRLLVPLVCLALTTICFLFNVGLRIASYYTAAGPADYGSPPILAIDLAQLLNAILSIITNISATMIICCKVWQYRKLLKTWTRSTPNRTLNVLMLIIESGFLYSAFGFVMLASIMIKIPSDTVGDIYNPLSLTLAGAYPTVVILIINLQSSADQTLQWQLTSRASQPSASRAAAPDSTHRANDAQAYPE